MSIRECEGGQLGKFPNGTYRTLWGFALQQLVQSIEKVELHFAKDAHASSPASIGPSKSMDLSVWDLRRLIPAGILTLYT